MLRQAGDSPWWRGGRSALTLPLAATLALLCTQALSGEPRFVDRAPELGIAHSYEGGWEHFGGGGVAVFDCDGDGLAELYAAGGANPATLLRNRSARGGGLRFAAETPDALSITGVTGAYPLDIDGDGIDDLAILRVGADLILKGDGACGFSPFVGLGFESGDRWTTAFSATWEDGAALPSLAFGHYVDRADPNGPFEACDDNALYRPEDDRYSAPIALTPGYCALSMLFTDWARTGRADLRVSNDRHYYIRDGAEQMWAMEGAPRLYGEADGWRRQALWGMGIASRDLDGDGVAEVMLTSMGDQVLQYRDLAAQGPRYVDAPYEAGATAHRPYMGEDGRPSTGWHAEFGDVDNDGFDDLFIAKGNVDQMPSMALSDPNNLLMGTPEGRFVEAGAEAGVASPARGRGGALHDLNLDGRLDMIVVNRRAPLEIYENMTERPGGFVALRLNAPAPNTRAVGAHVELNIGDRTLTREVTVGGGHAGGASGWIHFGVGEAGAATLRVIWPSGAVSRAHEIRPNRHLTVAPGVDGALSVRRF
ncbi:MAG: CRTAC1 family protein [Pseudomonadota bacterium]